MSVPIICKFDEDPIKNEVAIILTTFSHYMSNSSHMTYRNTRTQSKYRNTHQIYRNTLDFITTWAQENQKNSRSGPKLRILDRFQTPQNANKLVHQVCALNPIFPQPTNFHESMMSKKSQTVKSSQTDNVRAPFKCDIMVVKRL